MKIKLTFLTAFIFFTINVYSQCPNDNVFYSDISPDLNSTITENCIQSGKYITTSVISGHVYKFSLCDNSNSEDTVLTLYTSTGTLITSNDDFCDSYSEITWTADFTGSVRLMIDEYGCTSNSNCKVLKVTHTFPDASNCPINYSIICDAFNFTVTNTNTDASTLLPNNNYGCLESSPSPSWFYFRINNSGNLNFNLTAPQDIDYILYGPFSDLATADAACGAYGTGGTKGNVISCSYSTSANEFVSIPDAITNQVYILLVTNYAGTNQSVDVTAPTGGGTFSCVTLGTESFEKLGAKMYPNPTSEVITLELKEYNNASTKIIDLNGRVLNSQQLNGAKTTFDVSYLSSGMYFLQINSKKGTATQKFIKQ